jgi:hypothetical protein
MKKPNDNSQTEDPEAPASLIAGLRKSLSESETVFVPSTFDNAIERAARAHLSGERAPRFRWMTLLAWVTAATAIIVAGLFLFLPSRPGTNLVKAPDLAREDINGDGKVDILDAFALARQLRNGAVPNRGLDLNGDGIVDERDLQIIAGKAVRLDKRRHS